MSTKFMADLVRNLASIHSRINGALGRCPGGQQCQLVAVSKTKSVEDIQVLYDEGHRHFGESYVQEIVEKAIKLPGDIKWHFIGHLQSNKVKRLIAGVPNLFVVEGVDSKKLANTLNRACKESGRADLLKVMVQVNTSGEEQKSGVAPDDECTELAQHIHKECPNLNVVGLMTIGKLGDPTPQCFRILSGCRKLVSCALSRNEADIGLSMGMSDDFEQAIEHGSTNVRVGTSLFGKRDYAASRQ